LSPHTASRILAAFDRLQRELGIDYDKLIKFVPVVVLHALVSQDPALNRVLPNAAELATFESYIKQVETREGLASSLKDLEEPSVEDLSRILSFLRSLSSLLKGRLQRADAQIRPLGGPPEKLSDPVQVSAMVDEIFETCRISGKSLGKVQEEVANNKDVSLKTVQRRYREEMQRRKSISDSQHNNS
jgi:hypothetical protein